MTAPVVEPHRANLAELRTVLDMHLARIWTLVHDGALTEDGAVEIMSIYNSVAHLLLLRQAFGERETVSQLADRWDAFYRSPELDRELCRRLRELRCTDSEVEESRQEFVDQLRRAEHSDPAAEERIASLLAEAKALLDETERSQRELLQRLVPDVPAGSPRRVFDLIVAGTSNAANRHRLAQAWSARQNERTAELVDRIDAIVAARRGRTQRLGHPSVLAETMARSRVREKDIERFLDDYLGQALPAQVRLVDEIRAATTEGRAEATRGMPMETGDPLDHFRFVLRTVSGPHPLPPLPVDRCLEFLTAVASAVFGLELYRVEGPRSEVLAVEARQANEPVGLILFDVWDAARKAGTGAHTRAIRNRTDWPGMVQHPIAYVSCRFPPGAHPAHVMFTHAVSLGHEFGHAVNHLLIRKRISFRSGLENLPPERAEILAMWFEKWFHHRAFAEHLGLTGADREALDRAGRVRMLEFRSSYAERASVATLDFEMHRRAEGGLRAMYAWLDERHGVGRYCSFDTFPPYFLRPAFMANPGANVSYLWAAAESARLWRPFANRGLDEIAAQAGTGELFEACFDIDRPSSPPPVEAVFAFHDVAGFKG